MKSSSLKSYSRYVGLMKVILPVGIVLFVGGAIGWPYFQTWIQQEQEIKIDMSHPEITENRMVNPHYLSTDKKGQPFEVNAEWAKNQKEGFADLINPEGSLKTNKGETLNLKAQTGHYDQKNNVLELEGQVTLTSTDGYKVTTSKAHMTIEDNVIDGNSYIEGSGPTGEIMGQNGFELRKSESGKNIITLKGPSRVVINKASLNKKKDENVQ